jgi:hypothetical protein
MPESTRENRLKLRIEEKTYDYQAAMNEGTLESWRDLKEVTGIGRQSLQRALLRFGELESAEAIFEDVEMMNAIIVLAWLCKHHAGENPTLAECGALHFNDLEFVPEEGDEPAPDPTVASEAEASRGKSNGGKSSKSGTGKLVSAPL